jgi:hypothetical protein
VKPSPETNRSECHVAWDLAGRINPAAPPSWTVTVTFMSGNRF